MTARESRREEDVPKGNQFQGGKEVGIENLKNQINLRAKQLNEMHSELVFTEKAIEVLS